LIIQLRPQKKIPANDHDNFDEDDKLVLLESWLLNNAPENLAIKYVDIDNELKIELGSAKKLLPEIFRRNDRFSMDLSGGNVFKFSYDSSPF
jgi:hypothetical protein